MEHFDVIVVGGGPSGLSAALGAARQGMKTLVIERGDFPGSKNVMGGVLYTRATEAVIPEFWQDAPLERPVIEQRYGFLSGDEILSAAYRDPAWAEPPYNAHTVLRVKFDRWLAKKAQQEGVLILTETVVEDLLYQGDQVVGVRTGRAEGDIGGKVVILAEGANSFVAHKAGLAHALRQDTMAVAVKEIIALPVEKIEDRFNLEPHQGATIELFGDSTDGMLGTAFIYTNKNTLSVGVGVIIKQLIAKKWTPNDLLENLKAKPFVKRLIQGGETKEYLAHLLPEGGYNALPKLYRQGVLVVGDAAMLVNGLHREGSNLAMTSGLLAGEVAAESIRSNDTSEQALSVYEKRLRETFVIKDLHKYRNTNHFFENNPHFFEVYPGILTKAAHLFFTADETPKKERQKEILQMVKSKRASGALIKDLYGVWGALR